MYKLDAGSSIVVAYQEPGAYLLLSGAATLTLNGRQTAVKAGDLVQIPEQVSPRACRMFAPPTAALGKGREVQSSQRSTPRPSRPANRCRHGVGERGVGCDGRAADDALQLRVLIGWSAAI
jgi:hypothetical protein